MLKWICSTLDLWVIKMAARKSAPPGRFPAHIDEARAILCSERFFDFPANSPESFVISDSGFFQFASSYRSDHSSNDLVYGRFHPARRDGWEKLPTVLLLHGWNDEIAYYIRFPRLARRLKSCGINAIQIQLPFHMNRRPTGKGEVRDFISENVASSMKATQQALFDLASTVQWLRGQGIGRVGFWGASLGAWLGGLFVSHSTEIDFAVLTTPVVEMGEVIQKLEICEPIRRSLAGENIDLSSLDLSLLKPKISKENILVQEGMYDQFVTCKSVERLAERWDCELWQRRHGHISILVVPSLLRQTLRWVRSRAGGE